MALLHSAALRPQRNCQPVCRLFFALVWGLSLAAVSRGADALEGGVSMIPKDAAFVSATLRLQEQIELVLGSNAVAAIRKLPVVSQALAQIEEQKLQPGSPLSMLDTYLQLPENKQAVELLRDMVSSDTFLYGEPSCITFVELIQKVNQAQNAANILQMARGGVPAGVGVQRLELDRLEMDDDSDEPDDDDGSSVDRGMSIVPVRRQVAEIEEFDLGTAGSGEQLTTRLVLQALADNADKIVVPDLVWGFKTDKAEIATTQIKRIEILLKLVTQTSPAFSQALERREIAGGEVVVLTLDGGLVPWGQILNDEAMGDAGDLDKVRQKLAELDICIALGLIGDRVILSIGDSADHLTKLVSAGGDKGLASTKPFEPLREHRNERITAISYMSEALAKAVAPSAADIEQLAALSDQLAESADLPPGAGEEAREMLSKVAAGYKRRLPTPGPSLGYSFLTDKGYEGYTWDWSRNGVLDASKRLDLLGHTGGSPLLSLVSRAKTPPGQFDDFVDWARMAWKFAGKNLLSKADADDQERIEETTKQLAPLAERLVTTLRTKILPAVAEGQTALVVDGREKVERLQRAMPAAAEPLPIVAPAIALKLVDPKLFREGLSDLFALADDLVEEVRSLNPGSVPDDYRIPEPGKTKVDGGSLWTFAMPQAELDEQIMPTIGIGEDVAVFSFVPKQATRMLVGKPQETGNTLSSFDEPLGVAAAADVAGLVDAIEPWVEYFVRIGNLQQRNGFVDGESTIGPDGDDDRIRDQLGLVNAVLDALRCLRVAVADASTRSDATVIHWRNVIRDIPAER
jgi:hypothetical protein